MESFEDETPVAIKLFRMIESDAQFRDFQREAKIMKTLEHENIVKIYGFREEPLLIIMEYMNFGSLLTYLSIHRPDLKVENLLHFAANIAKVRMKSFEQEIASLYLLYILGNAISRTKENCSQRLGGTKCSCR